MHTDSHISDLTQTKASSQVASPLESVDPEDSNPSQTVIANLTEQLRRENEIISRLVERQKQLRRQLLKAQEHSLAAVRRTHRTKQNHSDR